MKASIGSNPVTVSDYKKVMYQRGFDEGYDVGTKKQKEDQKHYVEHLLFEAKEKGMRIGTERMLEILLDEIKAHPLTERNLIEAKARVMIE